jgi:predicted amidohydrolase YtcJ
MDPKQPRVEAVAVNDGEFVAVGTLQKVKELAGKGATIDNSLADKVVIAGFVEQHVHPVLAALTMSTKVISIEDWDAIDGFSPAVRDPKGYLDRLTQAMDEHTDKSKPFVTWGYHHYMHGELSREVLNKLAPDFPVIVWHRSAHELFLNNSALKLTGIDAEVIARLPKAAQEQIQLDKGHFYEQGAIAVLGKVAPFMASPERFKQGLEYTVDYYHRNGITIACEPGGITSKSVQDAINAVYSDDSTPFNHYFIPDGKEFLGRHPNDAEAVVASTEKLMTWGRGRTKYMRRRIKFFTDGAIFSQLMKMKTPYTDGHEGAWITDPPTLSKGFQIYWDAGYQIHVHNNGDAGLDVLLGELEKAMKRNPRTDHRTVLVHFGFAQPEQVKRWIELGGIVSSNPYYVTALSGPYAKIGLGPERAKNIAPHKYVLDNKGSLSFHSDMPMAPAKPLQLVWAGVNRLTYEGHVAGPEHKVPLDVALRAITVDAAYSIGLEKELGSIEIGKSANLTILEKSPYAVDLKDLKDIRVWGTMLEGRLHPVKTAGAQRKSSLKSADGRSQMRSITEPFGMSPSWDTRTNLRACVPGCSCSIGHWLGHYIDVQIANNR